MTRTNAVTPIRGALKNDSTLQGSVQDGLAAVENPHKKYFSTEIRADFADSLEIDRNLRPGREQENRWDYLLGHAPSGEVIAVEPHSASQGEISTVIRKRTAAREQLREHLRDGARIAKWLWVASGKVHFVATEKVKLQLDQNGIEFVGAAVMAKHLPTAPSSAAAAPREPGKRKR
ncbi:MAG: hypothetical protein IPG63_08930 [Xanthomonadales bacterium]|nr:hypothetical protein [Xanthomonadales bacterium]MBK7144517.1 hypothetical protein [Xanthomonadales bacterium]